MKAVRISEFGGPEVMKLEEIERPVPASDEILVKVYASGINPMDWKIRGNKEVAERMGIKLPFTPGWDAAGPAENSGLPAWL